MVTTNAWASSCQDLTVPEHTNVYPTFHVSEIKRHVPNNADLFPSRELHQPGPVVTQTGTEEWEIDHILDCRTRGRGRQYLVRWRGYGPEADVWVAGKELEGTDILTAYLRNAISNLTEEDQPLDAHMTEEEQPHDAHWTEEDQPLNAHP